MDHNYMKLDIILTALGSLSCLAFMCSTSMGGPSLTPEKRDMSVATCGADCVLYFVQVLIQQLVAAKLVAAMYTTSANLS